MKTNKQKKFLRWLVTGGALGLVILTFTPLVLHPGKIEPKILSMPFTLWISILITIILVVLTYLASKLQDQD
jgi:hypothetical protein